MPTQKLTNEIITAAILGFEEQKRHIDTQIAELRAVLSGVPAGTAATPEPAKRKRRKMSAAGRKAIAEAQRKRWAKSKKQSEPTAAQESPKPKRKLSAAGRKAIIAATKKRWALKRAEAAKAQSTVAKKSAPQKAAKKSAPVKKPAVKKSAPKKTAAAAAQSVTETGGQ